MTNGAPPPSTLREIIIESKQLSPGMAALAATACEMAGVGAKSQAVIAKVVGFCQDNQELINELPRGDRQAFLLEKAREFNQQQVTA